jgi:hypothetical protein
MDRNGMVTMSMRELDRLKAIQAVADGLLMPWRAAERLGISRRQVERLTSRYRTEGATGLISCKRERPSNHQLPAGLADHALAIIRERYADFGPTLACEKLRESPGLPLVHQHTWQTALARLTPRPKRNDSPKPAPAMID